MLSVGYNTASNMAYYGTTNSNIGFTTLDKKKKGIIKGRSPIVDYSILTSKRYLVTKNRENSVQLWNLHKGKQIFDFAKGYVTLY